MKTPPSIAIDADALSALAIAAELARSERMDAPNHSPFRAGPLLYARGADGSETRIDALIVIREGDDVPLLTTGPGEEIAPETLDTLSGHVFLRYPLRLPVGEDARYSVGGQEYEIAADMTGDVRLGYVSCNGKENGDLDRPAEERNAMWARLLASHRADPLALLMHGGDQLYADEVLFSHPDLHAWHDRRRHDRGDIPMTAEMEEAAIAFYLDRYIALYAAPQVAPLMAEVPSIMMWDDHDIFDGWGSFPAALLDSPVARGVFEIARRFFLLFQQGTTPGLAVPNGLAPDGDTLSLAVDFPGFRIVVPDLRSERRLDQVMGRSGWQACERAFAENTAPQVFVMSSVPALGPRLSVVEFLHSMIPGGQQYEDDLRDQWQSRAHREEWKRFLRLMANPVEDGRANVTVVSGEIHVASRGEMALPGGRKLQQLTASGIAHPPPPRPYADIIGYLAALGEGPLKGRPISLRPLPGQRPIYTDERNFLTITRKEGAWQARWTLEKTGETPPLDL